MPDRGHEPSGTPTPARRVLLRMLDRPSGSSYVEQHGDQRGIPAQADELPAPHPDLRRAAEELPRAAGAAGRVRHGLPLRAVGRAVGADPRPRLHPGRRPPVLHPRAGARRVPLDDGDDPVLPRIMPGAVRLSRPALEAATRTTPSTRGRPATSGDGPRTTSARCSTRWACPTRRPPARRRSTARRPTSSSATASAGSGSSARSSSTTSCPSGSASNTPAPTTSRTGR